MVRLVQNSFLGGQLDYEMMGRQDFSRYAKGASRLLNFNIMRRGGICKRQGFDRVCSLSEAFTTAQATVSIGATERVRLIPFAHKKNHGLVLVLTSGRMRVVRAAPAQNLTSNVWEAFTVDGYGDVTPGGDTYVGDDIYELDYQQCGDKIFIAHQNHKPSVVEHHIENGVEWFSFKAIPTGTTGGRPTINSATITRAPVHCGGATFTESYVATAVYSDGETIPTEAKEETNTYNPTQKQVDKNQAAASWKSTTYHMPWTESQTITIKVTPGRKDLGGGAYEYPKEIRLYKKSFNYYGLMAAKKLDAVNNVDTRMAKQSSAGYTAVNSPENDTFYTIGYSTENTKNAGYTAVSLQAGGRRVLKLSSGSNFKSGTKVKIRTGVAYMTWIMGAQGGDREGERVDAEFHYVANKASAIKYLFTNSASAAATSTLNLVAATDATVAANTDNLREASEAEGTYVDRIENAFQTWVAGLPAAEGQDYVEVTCTGSYKYLVIDVPSDATGAFIEAGYRASVPGSAPGAVTFIDKNIVPDSSVTPPEALDPQLFKSLGNYPGSVSLTQQRLVWASSKNEPERIWMSQVGDFYTYNPHQIQVADDPIDFVLPVTRFPKINHMVEMRKMLLFNSACEWMLDSASSVSGITYESIQAYPQSYSGSNARLKPLVCNNSVVFAERSGQSVRRFAWDLANDGFAGKDVSILSSSIFEHNPIVDWTYQQFPYSTIWCALADGGAASFEYMEEQDILAWATHRHGGGRFRCFATTHGLSPAMDLLGNDDANATATQEEVFAVVQHGYYDAQGVWHATDQVIERMRVKSKPRDTVYHSLCLDSVRALDGYHTGHTTGPIAAPMDALYDQATDTWSWGNAPQWKDLVYIPMDTTDGKPITRQEALERLLDPDDDVIIYEGYPYKADFMSVYPVISRGTIGAGQFDIKDIGNVGLRLMASYGGTVRAEGCDETEPIKYPRRYKDGSGTVRTPGFGVGTADFGEGVVEFADLDAANVKPVGINIRDGRFHVEQADPWPFQLLMYELDVEAEVGRGYY